MEKKDIRIKYQKSDNYKEAYSNVFQYGVSPLRDHVDLFFDEDTIAPFDTETYIKNEDGTYSKTHEFLYSEDFIRVRHARIKMPVDAARALISSLTEVCNYIESGKNIADESVDSKCENTDSEDKQDGRV